MLEHHNTNPKLPTRVVVLGAGGFVGRTSADRVEQDGASVLRLGRQTADLLTEDAAENLAAQLRADDVLVVVSALAPCKNTTMLVENVRMMDSVCCALQSSPVDHVVYISSDAVYADSPDPLNEGSVVQPESLHGVMHAAREVMLREVLGETPIAVLRPSLLYGATDPHNGYGPNQFRRKAFAGEDILLFGEGEERRDHVLVDDVAEIVRLVLLHRSEGALNVATGTVTAFKEVAEMVARQFDPAPLIRSRPRMGPMPHNGYRPFDPTACRQAFPDFTYTPLDEGIALCHAAERFGRHGHG